MDLGELLSKNTEYKKLITFRLISVRLSIISPKHELFELAKAEPISTTILNRWPQNWEVCSFYNHTIRL